MLPCGAVLAYTNTKMGPARLFYMDEAGSRRGLPLKGTVVTVGRARDNMVTFPRQEGVSRYHAELVGHDEGWVIVDRGSSAGTFVNGVQVQQHPLESGDVIRLGPPPAPELTYLEVEEATALRETPEMRDDSMTIMRPAHSTFLDPEKLQAASAGKGAAQLVQRMRALFEVTTALLQVHDVDALCRVVLEAVFRMLAADRGAILLRAGNVDDLVQKAAHVRPGQPGDGFAPSRTITHRVLDENVGVLSMDASTDERFEQGASLVMQSVRSVVSAPISSAGHVWGVLYLDTTLARRSFAEDDLELLVAVGRQAAMAMQNLHLVEEQQKTFESMMRALAHSIDARDGITAGHSSRVAKYSQAIGRHLGLSSGECRIIWYAGLLHDYGKIGTREAVLTKPGPLTSEEYEHMKEHPKHTFRILSSINFSPEMRDIPRIAASHHERPDGTGYPFGWKGDEIPMGGRIIAVADFFDALTVRRHYREPAPLEEVQRMIVQGRGTQFDHDVVEAFGRWFDREYVPFARRMAERRAIVQSADELSSHKQRTK
ncbi:MAG: HD domain-containing protein [Deltaproteobacteria bacterium]|nr:HD domain-containing protein [Deltaproteobacteria bacterium]